MLSSLLGSMVDFDQAIEEGTLCLVGEFEGLTEVNEYALVILAMNLDCWIRAEAEAPRFLLYAEPAFEVAIVEEFRLYEQEQLSLPERAAEISFHRSGVELLLLWTVILMVTFMGQTESMVAKYCNSSEGIFGAGEWHRSFTALFLHADGGHLLGNVLIGGIFCVFVARTFGPVRGWISILASGTLGNLMTSWVHFPEGFKSLGASTATFGALGLLVGSSALLAYRSRSARKVGGFVIPFIAGAILLGWFGAGAGDAASRVDVLAHVMGFFSGALIGSVLARNTPASEDDGRAPA
ncbi:MAG: hypothetical protein CMP26_00860 [Roseibacillus sp.]|nr:hypothetical protein [Roseibacillus sp.]HAO96284.1 hypothetical protein [Verrucomicrobiales bacterium]